MKFKRFISVFLLCTCLTGLFLTPAAGALEVPDIQARAALLADVNTDAVAYAKNIHEKNYPASLTKVMTALLILEKVSGNETLLNQEVTASENAFSDTYYHADGSSAGIKAGEVMTVKQLLQCMLIVSANEACNILAEWDVGSIAAFVDAMNAKAKALGCENTHFVNPSGLHDPDHYTSAWDLYLITKAAMQYPEFMEICDSAKAVIPATNLSKERTLYTTNHLLSTWRVIGYRDKRAHGIKTGSTSDAGHCLISSAQEGELHFVSVVMGAERIEENGVGNLLNFSETSHLFDYGFKNFAYRTILEDKEIIQEVPVSLSKTDYVTVHPANNVESLFPRDLDPAELDRVISLPEAVEAPITAGDKLGTMELRDGDTVYASVDLLASSDVTADKFMVFRHNVTLFFKKPAVKTVAIVLAVLLVLLVEVMFLYSATRSYYNGIQQTMYRRFSSITGQLKMYTGETSQKTAASRSVALRRMVEQFSDKDKYEFMLLDSYGGVIASSSGTDAEGIVTRTDFEQAQDAVDGQGIAIYRTQSGEMVMAACCLVPYAAEDVAAMRLVTSLTLVEEQLKRTVVVALIMGAAVLAFTIMSGLYFVRSIVVPLGQVERTAAGIARGELDVRLPVTGDERDEVDRLRGTINRMAEGLEETEKMKNEFISSVSHELRTPLTSIRGWVETLRTLDDPSDENYRKGLEIINNETARLYNMVEELLDFSRLQNGRLKMTCRPLDLVAELTDAVLFCEARIQREGLVLVYNEPEEMIPVYADPDRLRQVFINILDNAIKYSAPGGRITVKLWAGEYKAFIEFIDQGRGIPPEDLENVKTKFYKGSNSVRGSGIGLALVDSIMTALDGTMDIKSTLGRGTVVTLGLPLYKK